MKKKINLWQIDAFTPEPFHGNAAGVVFTDELTSHEMQLIASEMNLSETAFISSSKKADYNLRWFTPTVEVNLCGHATIASLHFLSESGKIKDGSITTFDTLSGIIKCRFEKGIYYMHLPVPKLFEYNSNRNEILEALGLNLNEIDSSFPFVYTDGGYVYIHLKSLNQLKSIKPNFNLLSQLLKSKKEFDCITVYTTETIEKNSSAHIRFFAPNSGIDEDPVTGSANGPMLMVLKHLKLINENTEDREFTFEQGDWIDRKGRVYVSY
ncbi:MAG TPA: PhzF family phenazine biosynthesis protein, partial [Ignavibacteriaceae bacterium]